MTGRVKALRGISFVMANHCVYHYNALIELLERLEADALCRSSHSGGDSRDYKQAVAFASNAGSTHRVTSYF